MVVNAHGVATLRSSGGKSVVSFAMLAQSVHHLDNASHVARRLPEMRVNIVAIASGQNLVSVL
jgi:hypothetical protein